METSNLSKKLLYPGSGNCESIPSKTSLNKIPINGK